MSHQPKQAAELFEVGISAVQSGDTKTGVPLLESALKQGISGESEARAHLYLAIGYMHLTEEDDDLEKHAAEYAEQALREDKAGGFGLFEKTPARNAVFSWLDGLWALDAEEIKDEDGVSAALEFLQSKVALVEHLPVNPIALVHFEIGHLLANLNAPPAEVGASLRKVVEAEIPVDEDNELILEMYTEKRARAAEFIGALERSQSGEVPSPQPAAAEKGGCWIATAVYGAESQEVATLRLFRDTVLLNCGWGKEFVSLYYRTSPLVAREMGRYRLLHLLIKSLIVKPALFLADAWIRMRRGNRLK